MVATRKKAFEVTPDGRYIVRPYGRKGAAYEVPDRGSFNRARLVVHGLLVVVFIAAVANIFHRIWWITVIVALVTLAAFYAWMAAAKQGWQKVD